MYEYLTGTVQSNQADAVIVDIQGIGYRVCVPKSCETQSIGKKITLYIEFIVREDAHTLYGFVTPQDRDFFRLLQQVSGIGPKLAVSIMGHASTGDIANAIYQKDHKALFGIPGIGKKLAERLTLELHERIEDLMSTGSFTPSSQSTFAKGAIHALETLGFSATEARTTIAAAQQTAIEFTSIEELVQHALRARK